MFKPTSCHVIAELQFMTLGFADKAAFVLTYVFLFCFGFGCFVRSSAAYTYFDEWYSATVLFVDPGWGSAEL